MKTGRVLAMSFLLCVPSVSFAQFVATGKVTSVDEKAGTMGIIVKSVSAEGPPVPKAFKVLDTAAFASIKPGDSVTFTSKNISGILTIEKIAKQ